MDEKDLLIFACDLATEAAERRVEYKVAVWQRDEAVRAAVNAGIVRWRVANVTGLSRERVQQITQTTRRTKESK